jgi:hypothetical protein
MGRFLSFQTNEYSSRRGLVPAAARPGGAFTVYLPLKAVVSCSQKITPVRAKRANPVAKK